MSGAFARLANVPASTRRNPAAVAGKIGAPVAHLTRVNITAPLPVSQQIIETYRLQSPRESYIVFAQGKPDILEGDVLVVGSVQYQVKVANQWLEEYIELVVERVKGT